MTRNDETTASSLEDPAQPLVTSSIDSKDLLRYVARARVLQGEAMAYWAGAALRAAGRGLARAHAWLRRRRAASITRRELDRLSDHMLKDIGIDRYAIPACVEGLLAGADPRAVSAEILVHRAAAVHSAGPRAGGHGPRDLAA